MTNKFQKISIILGTCLLSSISFGSEYKIGDKVLYKNEIGIIKKINPANEYGEIEMEVSSSRFYYKCVKKQCAIKKDAYSVPASYGLLSNSSTAYKIVKSLEKAGECLENICVGSPYRRVGEEVSSTSLPLTVTGIYQTAEDSITVETVQVDWRIVNSMGMFPCEGEAGYELYAPSDLEKAITP